MSGEAQGTVNQAVQQAVQAQAPVQTQMPQPAPGVTATVNPAPQPAPAEVLPQGMAKTPDGKVQVLSQSAYKRLKDEAREQGRKNLLKEFGFKNMDEAKAAFQRGQTPQQAPVSQPQAAPQQPATQTAPQAQSSDETKRLSEELDSLRRQVTRESSKSKQLQEAIDQKEAEMVLREAAINTGIQDVDYALRLLTRELEGKDEEYIGKFNENTFFAGLRESKPYLFKETIRPATTGVGAGAPPSPRPGEAARNDAQTNSMDALKLTKEQYTELLRQRGLSINL